MVKNGTTVAVLGHPFASIGMGEQMRAGIRSLAAVHVPYEIIDVYHHSARTDREHRDLIADSEVDRCTSEIRIFHINGDEVVPILHHIDRRKIEFEKGYNIIMPAWELPTYPKVWREALERFDEVWSISKYVSKSLDNMGIKNFFIGQSAEIPLRNFLPRRHFDIRETAFVFLHFFDLSSYASRKNPDAVLGMFRKLRAQRPFADIQLVLKVKGDTEGIQEWISQTKSLFPDTVIITDLLSTFETHSLLAACDCLVSLHRAEGFGRGPAEAMFLGRIALATAWSGNVDYMTADASLMVDFTLRPVALNEYPESEGQEWAYADVEHAAALAIAVLDSPAEARRIAANGFAQIRSVCSNRAVGLRMLERLEAISKSSGRPL